MQNEEAFHFAFFILHFYFLDVLRTTGSSTALNPTTPNAPIAFSHKNPMLEY
jgi:hypothetical protein